MRALLHFLTLIFMLGLSGHPVVAQTAASKPAAPEKTVEILLTGRESSATVERLINDASKGNTNVRVRVSEPAPAANTDAATVPATAPAHGSTTAVGETSNFLTLVGRGIAVGLRGILALKNTPQRFSEHWARNEGELGFHAWLQGFLSLALAIAGGYLAWRITAWLVNARQPAPPPPSGLTQRVTESLRRGIADIVAITVGFNLARALNTSYVFAPTAPVTEFFAIIVDHSLSMLLILAVARFLLKPNAHGEALLAIPNPERYRIPTVIYCVIGPLALMLVNALYLMGSEPQEIAGAFLISSTIIASYKVWYFWSARQDVANLVRAGAKQGTEPGAIRALIARAAGPLLAAFPILIWISGRVAAVSPNMIKWSDAAAATQFFVLLGPLLAYGCNRLVHSMLTRSCGSVVTPVELAIRETAAAGAGALVWVLAVWDLGRVWSDYLDRLDTEGNMILRGLKAAALTLIAGYLCWVFMTNLFDGYTPVKRALPGTDDDVDDTQPTIQSRLSSVLPVLRGVLLALVAAITLLLVLSSLGIETSPLLAGFGIAGLALSFGSQALVRDVVSGIFFLADDAFRVGEYIDTGKLKGTVERITLRSVQLRHQSGLVHTIPYGQLQQVTNASRDWATIKFTIRLARDADIEVARKTIKKLGQELLTHPEFGGDFIFPVKLQGITDIQDNALVVRVKFTAKPYRTSQIQREALKRIYLKLTEAGVQLATTEVRVRSGSAEHAAAAFAAATPVTVQPGAAG